MKLEKITKSLSFLGKNLLNEIAEFSEIKEIPANTAIIKEGQYLNFVPVVIEGIIKVFSIFEDKELLLYYIQNGESCIMSFNACLMNLPSKVLAQTETESKILLLPRTKLNDWLSKYPSLNKLIYQQYNTRYTDLLETINQVLFLKIDQRILDYLIKRARLTNSNIIQVTHKQIAHDIGSAREVVSRSIKKLEHQNIVKQQQKGIEVFLDNFL